MQSETVAKTLLDKEEAEIEAVDLTELKKDVLYHVKLNKAALQNRAAIKPFLEALRNNNIKAVITTEDFTFDILKNTLDKLAPSEAKEVYELLQKRSKEIDPRDFENTK